MTWRRTVLAALVSSACALEPESPPEDAGEPSTVDAGDPASSEGDAGFDPPPDDGRSGAVVRYDQRFDLDTGAASITLALDPAWTEGCVELATEHDLVRLIPSVPVAIARDGDRLTLCDPPASEPVTLSADYTLPVGTDPGTQVGFSRTEDLGGRPFSYLLSWVERCPAVGLCDPHPAARSHFTVEIDHAPEVPVLCPGRRTVVATGTRCELLDTPAPTYTAFAIASNPGWIRKPLVTVDALEVVLFETPETRIGRSLARDADAIAAFLRWMDARFGAFPYGDELRIATGPTSWAGMEHPANIVISERLLDFPRVYANMPLHVVLHEIAHQWAGNRTTLADALDFAWKEAVAEYLVYVFEDEQRPPAEATSTRLTWQSAGRFAAWPARPSVEPGVPLAAWAPAVYGVGPMSMFLQLEPLLGREVLLDAIAAFLGDGGARSVADLRDAIEARSGESLDAWFDAWVFGVGEPVWPVFHVETAAAPGGTRVTVTQAHPEGRVFPGVVEVELVADGGAVRVPVRFGLAPAASSVSVVAPFDAAVNAVRVDPDRRLLHWTPREGLVAEPPPFRWHPDGAR